MLCAEVMTELESMGSEQTVNILRNQGAEGALFGVKVGDMKKILKRTKKDHALALELYRTGNLDAMYLAGLMADARKVSGEELDSWAQASTWHMVAEYAVAGLAAESPHGWNMGLKWIDAPEDHVQSAGWATLSGVAAMHGDADLDLTALETLLNRVATNLAGAGNRTRYTMNGFVIAIGCYVSPLAAKAMTVAEGLGKVQVNMGTTGCKVPHAPDTIKKIAGMGRQGQKRKKVRC